MHSACRASTPFRWEWAPLSTGSTNASNPRRAPRCLPSEDPFRISRGVKTVPGVVTVEISADGSTGRGEGVAYPGFGESVEGALAAIGAGGGGRERNSLQPRHQCAYR